MLLPLPTTTTPLALPNFEDGFFLTALPIYAHIKAIYEAVAHHQVVIVAGETGSGKTTQIPKILFLLHEQFNKHPSNKSKKKKYKIGHTQPRRLAAIGCAQRLGEEFATYGLDKNLVAHHIRFDHRASPQTRIKVMTDGILLAEIAQDPLLRQYDALIIDEAHERSLNIDFLLGYIKKILPQRPDLRVVITSATIDTELFAKHFGGAPIFHVSGRGFPIQYIYQAVEDMERAGDGDGDGDTDDAGSDTSAGPKVSSMPHASNESLLHLAIEKAMDDLPRQGDILVFLPGEYEIRHAAIFLRERQKHQPQALQREILPLYARLTSSQQQSIFKRGGTHQRVVLATNIAETSITVPNILYVIDTGLAKMMRYSYRQKIEQLRLEPISQAAAQQRAGRCGRVAPGICIRLYREADFLSRPAFTQAEILRSNLSGVVLKMHAMGLGDMAEFPFVQPPSKAAITHAYQVLHDLQALSFVDVPTPAIVAISDAEDSNNSPPMIKTHQITLIGREMAAWGMDVRLAKMLLYAKQVGCVHELLIIVSGLCIPDVREFSPEDQQKAKSMHGAFTHPHSEFLTLCTIWQRYLQVCQDRKSWREVQNWCKDHFLSFNRLKEWRTLHAQWVAQATQSAWVINTPHTISTEMDGIYKYIHQAILSGLFNQVACFDKEKNTYIGTQSLQFLPHPSSFLYKKKCQWVVAYSIQFSQRMLARTLAKIEPEWLLPLVGHLLKKNHSDGFWDAKQGRSFCYEAAYLYGLALYQKKMIHLTRVDEVAARHLYINALVDADIQPVPHFIVHNQKAWQKNQEKMLRARLQVDVDTQKIYDFYAQHIPIEIIDMHQTHAWLKKDPARASMLKMPDDFLWSAHVPMHEYQQLFPAKMRHGAHTLPLRYRFEPGYAWDGITLDIQLWQLHAVDENACSWLVPGMLKEKVHLLLKSLPQSLRKHLVPLNHYVGQCVESLMKDGMMTSSSSASTAAPSMHLLQALRQEIERTHGIVIALEDFKPQNLPAHLHMNFRLLDEKGLYIDGSQDLKQLQKKWQTSANQAFDAQIKPKLQATLAKLAQTKPIEAKPEDTNNYATHEHITTWTFAPLPTHINIQKNGQKMHVYPALVDMHTHTRLDLFETPQKAQIQHHWGMLRLFALQCKAQRKSMEKHLRSQLNFALQLQNIQGREGDPQALQAFIDGIFWQTFMPAATPQSYEALPKTREMFEAHIHTQQSQLWPTLEVGIGYWQPILQELSHIRTEMAKYSKLYPHMAQDMQAQWAFFCEPSLFLGHASDAQKHFARYIQAMRLRLDKIRHHPQDMGHTKILRHLLQQWAQHVEKMGLGGMSMLEMCLIPKAQTHVVIRYQIEELRVQYFAQNLKTPQPISAQRIEKKIEALYAQAF